MPTGIELKGFEEQVAKLKTLADIRQLAPAVKAGGLHAKRYLVKYPPAPSGPGPYPARWYMRGKGPHWALKGGGFHFSKTSETLGRRWGIKTEHGGLTVRLVNNASYGPLVQSREKQTRVHKRTGWLTVEDVAEQQGSAIKMFIMARINKILAGR